MVRPERLELPAYWFEASRSIQLSYGRTPRSRDLVCILSFAPRLLAQRNRCPLENPHLALVPVGILNQNLPMVGAELHGDVQIQFEGRFGLHQVFAIQDADRKSTRLNSSHLG